MFDYAAVPTATTTPASFNITTVVTAVISVVALLIVMLILVSGLSVLCVLHKRRTHKRKQATPVEIMYDEVNTLEDKVTDQIYEDIKDATRVDPTSDVPATTNVAYGVTLPQPPENIDDKYYI